MKTKEKKYPAADYNEKRYTEWDEEFGCWGVFGLDSGHCYGQYNTEKKAEESIPESSKTG